MKLKEIDKSRYSRHLKIVFGGIVVALLFLTLITSSLLIQVFSTPEAPHFWFNLGGVAVAAIIVIFVLSKLRRHPFLFEVVYVWDLKQILNRIYRKQRKIEAKLEENDLDAMIIMNFQYKGSKQLYELDDNTITIENLVLKIKALEGRMQEVRLSLSTDSFDPAMLEKY